ncbi:conserved hypothetical protein [Candidatus Desulfosporosinus infrequens]|uniref:DUF6385 domain-containing protein n=1 Tax=Candidatus Desulfosporosinus infrequens TaxID=2043169 RepID=A0A2U3KYB5_9FIRM|nr:conserved hypothetical protein [Candidatus Desulfosporosinus infrequens]
MVKNLKWSVNVLDNGDFSKSSTTQPNFPEAWLQIGGSHETSWKFGYQSLDKPVLEINNFSTNRAGIIQTQLASLEVGKNEEWLFNLCLKSSSDEMQAYLRIYPIMSKGDVSRPWEFFFRPRVEPEQFKQVISVRSDVWRLRLETGVLGPGHLSIYQLSAYPLSPNRMKRYVQAKHAKKEIPQISHIQTIGEIIKPIQLAMPIPLKIPVTVQANVNADVRNLTSSRDRVQICGSSQVPLATTSCGRAQVEIFGHGFQESLEDVTATQTMSATTTRDVSALTRFSFAVYNFGKLPAYIQAEFSPDGVHWAVESEQREVGPEKLAVLSPVGFLRYTRLSYGAGGLTTLRIWVQAQS